MAVHDRVMSMKIMSVRWLLLLIIITIIQCDQGEAKGGKGSKSKSNKSQKKKSNPSAVRIDEHDQPPISGDNSNTDDTSGFQLDTILIDLDERYLEMYGLEVGEQCMLNQLRNVSRNISQEQFTVHDADGDTIVTLLNFRFSEDGFSHAGTSINSKGLMTRVTYEGFHWCVDAIIRRPATSNVGQRDTACIGPPENVKMVYIVSLVRVNNQTKNEPRLRMETSKYELEATRLIGIVLSDDASYEIYIRMRQALYNLIGDRTYHGGIAVDKIIESEEKKKIVKLASALQLVIVDSDDQLSGDMKFLK